MIRYSASRSTICVTNPNTLTELVSPVQKAYRELMDLRQRVKRAEAAAKRLGARDKLKTGAPSGDEVRVAEANHAASKGIHQAPAPRHAG